MKTPEDEAFDELARKQGSWGSGYQAKRRMAADKLQEPEREALKLAVDGLEKILHTFAKDGKVVMSSMIRNELFAEVNSLLQQTKTSLAQPAQEPVAWMYQCTADNSGPVLLRHRTNWAESGTGLWIEVPLYTTPPKREWVGLTDADIERIKLMTYEKETNADGEEQEAVNIDWLIKTVEHFCKEKNT
jgi:hypothetical protein